MSFQDDRWWTPLIPLIGSPDGEEGYQQLRNLPWDVQSYLRVLGRSYNLSSGTVSTAPDLVSGMQFLANQIQQRKALWVHERLGDMKVLEEESWAAWCALLAQAYSPPDGPFISSATGGRLCVASHLAYTLRGELISQTNLRLPLPWQMDESYFSEMSQEQLDSFALRQYSAACYPLSRREMWRGYLPEPFEVQDDHLQDIRAEGRLPVPFDLPDNFPFTERKARRHIVDVVYSQDPQQRRVMILRINNLDINLRLLVHRSPGIPRETADDKGKWSAIRAKFVKRLRHGPAPGERWLASKMGEIRGL